MAFHEGMITPITLETVGLTTQQAAILRAALGLKARRLRCSPSALQAEYEKTTGRPIQKSNFFTQLRVLTTRALLAKRAGEYEVNLPALSKEFEERKSMLRGELDALDTQTKDLGKLTEVLGRESTPPLVEYHSLEKYFGILAKQIKDAELMYCNSSYPWVCFPYSIAESAGSLEYFRTLAEICEGQKATIKYITPFTLGYMTKLALKAAKNNRSVALRECLETLDTLRNSLEVYPKLHVRYIPRTLNLHFVVTKAAGEEPKNLFLFIFGEPGEISQGLLLNSPEMAGSVMRMFESEFDTALDMRSPMAGKVYSTLESQFKAALGGKPRGTDITGSA